jgi:O-antigen ligase
MLAWASMGWRYARLSPSKALYIGPVRALAWGLALSPIFPPLSLLSPLFLPQLRKLPKAAWAVLALYGLSLLLPALFVGKEALTLAALRLLYVLGLVGAGVALAPVGLGPLGYGLFVLYLEALLASYLAFGDRVSSERLLHPYHSPVGLGLMGTLGILLALHVRYPWPFRVLLGLLGGVVLLLSGSRGGLLALLVGGAAGVLFQRRGWLALGAAGLFLLLAGSLEAPVAQRFFQTQLSGREGLWLRAYEVFQAHPWTGVGPYLLGDELKGVLFGDCFLFPFLERRGVACPEALKPLGGLWTFAHNHLLQALGESGLLGAMGLLLLVGAFLAGAWGSGLLFSLLLAFLAMGMADNPFSVPSPFRGEVFFLAGGMALLRGFRPPLALGLAGASALLLSLPFLYLATRTAPPPPTLLYAAIPQGKGVGVVRLQGEGYRAQVWLCREGCRRLGWEWDASKPILFSFPENLPPGRYQVRIVLFGQHRLAQKPRYVLPFEVER